VLEKYLSIFAGSNGFYYN